MSLSFLKQPHRKTTNLLSTLLLLLSLSGCSLFDSELGSIAAEELSREGMTAYHEENYSTAIEYLEELISRFPFSKYAKEGELKLADCQYHRGKFVEAIASYSAFEQKHPTDKAMPYVLFQRAMCHFTMIDTLDRNTADAEKAITLFSRQLRTFPDSPYIDQAKINIGIAQNFLAGHELYVAKYYIKVEKIKPAIARLEYLGDNYPNSTYNKEASKLLSQLKKGDLPPGKWYEWIPNVGQREF